MEFNFYSVSSSRNVSFWGSISVHIPLITLTMICISIFILDLHFRSILKTQKYLISLYMISVHFLQNEGTKLLCVCTVWMW